MIRKIKAVFRDGAFVPIDRCDLPADGEYELLVQGPLVEPPHVVDAAQRAQIAGGLVDRMQRNPIPPSAPAFTREELHERG